jgi:excisionase family DNA binding protein
VPLNADPLQLHFSLDSDQLAELAARVLELLHAELARSVEPWPDWMSIETASRYLDCTIERLRKLVARHQIPYHQDGPGCRIFFHRPDLDHWMHTFRHEAAP